MKLGKLIGEGQRSRVYQHPVFADRVIKVTSDKREIEVLQAYFEEPESYFATIFELKFDGNKCYAVIQKVQKPDFKFKLQVADKNGARFFFESSYNKINFIDCVIRGGQKLSEYKQHIKSIVSQPELVDEYYNVLVSAYNHGLDVFDTAWNIGFVGAKMVCFDSQFSK